MKINKELLIRLSSRDLSIFDVMKLYSIFLNLKEDNINYIKSFIDNYYNLENGMPDDFYKLFLSGIHGNKYKELFDILLKKDIYELISFLKFDKEDVSYLIHDISPQDYYNTPKRYINFLIGLLQCLSINDEKNPLRKTIETNPNWLLKRNPTYANGEYMLIAYKIFLSIGLDNGIDLLTEKYGKVDYEIIHYMFFNLNVNDKNKYNDAFINFLFNNKKDSNNVVRLMFKGDFNELFINFAYFYNSLDLFINKLGTKMNINKVKVLLKERYLAPRIENPEISGDILEDMISSYFHKYDIDESKEEILKKNMKAYNEKLKNKTKSSIPSIKINEYNVYIPEIIPLNDPRNLVMGYRAGNCFRINADAQVFLLFNNFLTNPHMRIISISTLEYKDFAMVLVMRNGNVLIGQGIEVSKRVPNTLKGQKLYEACKFALKELMNYMNENDDEIVCTIMGMSNSNVSNFNNNIIPFIINPLIDDNHNYYNGIDNYECLLDLKEGKTLSDIKLFTPSIYYYDKRPVILSRTREDYHDNTYMEIEKRLISLRYKRFITTSQEDMISYYHELTRKREIYTICSLDWYITLFDDNSIDSFIATDDEIAIKEYSEELKKIKSKIKQKSTIN